MERLLFYNSANGAGALGIFAEDGFATEHSFAPGEFRKSWTHVTELPGTGGQLLFYAAATGEGAVGELWPGSFVTAKSLPAGAYGTWTHVVGTLVNGHPSTLFYNAVTGATGGRLVFSVGSMSFTASLLVDSVRQQVIQNVLNECLS